MSTVTQQFPDIRFFYDTEANWLASTRRLRIGEVAVVTDANYIKFGNGTSNLGSAQGAVFSALPKFSASNAKLRTATAINASATALAAAILGGLITSTSAAAVAMPLDTVAHIVTALAAVGITVARGTTIDFYVDNVLGASTITVAAGTGTTTASALTGGTALTVAAGARAKFELYFVSQAAAILSRAA